MSRFGRLFHLGFSLVFISLAATTNKAQEPVPPPPDAAAQPQPSPASAAKPGRYSYANGYLVRGTVFTEKGLAFANVELRLRPAGEKKFRWRTLTNSRGEFAIRVPKGSEYEMVVSTKGFKDQLRTIDAKSGLTEENIIFRMEALAGDKK
jgi:Carboxypeptidase regulatory-like domain